MEPQTAVFQRARPSGEFIAWVSCPECNLIALLIVRPARRPQAPKGWSFELALEFPGGRTARRPEGWGSPYEHADRRIKGQGQDGDLVLRRAGIPAEQPRAHRGGDELGDRLPVDVRGAGDGTQAIPGADPTQYLADFDHTQLPIGDDHLLGEG
jgi:hypothetical protein